MPKIIVFTKDSCTTIIYREAIHWNSLFFQVIKKQLVCRYKEQQIRIQENQFGQVGKYKVFYQTYEKEWKMIPYSRQVTIGRGKDCDIQFFNPNVSQTHARICVEDKGILVTDLNSTNGTYVAGKRIKEKWVMPGECLMISHFPIVLFPSFLLSPEFLNNEEEISLEPLKRMEPLEEHSRVYRFQWDTPSFEIELPQMEEQNSISLFQSIGSSIMILISGLLTTGILSYTQDSRQMVFPMMISNGAMGLSFLMFGLFNYSKNKRNSETKRLRNEKQYQDYLKEKEEQIWQIRQQFLLETKNQKSICQQMDSNSYGHVHPLLAGTNRLPWIDIQHPRLAYNQKDHPLSREMQKIKQIGLETLSHPVFWEKGKRLLLKNGNEETGLALFLQFIWQHPPTNEKWIWIRQDLSLNHRVFGFSQCRIDDQPLWIRAKEDLSRLQDWLKQYPDAYIFSCEDWPEIWNVSNCTLCSIQGTNNTYYDHVIEEPLSLDADIDQRLRQVLFHTRQIEVQPLSILLDKIPLKNGKYMHTDKVSLKVPIGTDKDNQVISLDISEKKQGPHGLIAGMTGSGKSEWMSAFLMQLVLNNSSELLQYLLIDFKGGAFGKHFYEFPHCAGMITNMEDNQIERFFQSLDAEIEQRQKRLEKMFQTHPNSIFHIDSYNEYAQDKMSHLLILVDEFAQLKSKHPEYMEHLKEISRIGRSLGIHLLLATQKPMGVIDDQIWANSTFRICFRVNSKNDSREVLRNDKAYFLDEPGSFVLQVGNEMERTGQGFYLQEDINPNRCWWKEVDENNLVLDEYDSPSTTILQSLSDRVREVKQEHNWVVLPHLSGYTHWKDEWGMVDIPKEQKQEPLDLEKGQSCFVHYQRNEDLRLFLSAVITSYQSEPVYLMGSNDFRNCLDDFSGTIEQMENIKGTLLLVCHNENMLALVKPFLKNPEYRLFILSTQVSRKAFLLAQESSICLSLYDKDIDSIRILFNQHHIPSIHPSHCMGIVKVQDQLHLFYYPKKVAPNLQRGRQPFVRKKGLFLGYDDSQRAVYWQQERPLIVCYAQQSLKEEIEQWGKQLKEVDVSYSLSLETDLCIINMMFQQEQFQTSAYALVQYDMDLLWIGLGLQDYAFVIKKNPPIEWKGNAVLYQNQTVRSFSWHQSQ